MSTRRYGFNRNKRKISIVILFCIVVLFSGIKSYADEQKEKIFIGQFKGNASAIWCGNDALVVSSRESGIEWIDILSNKRIKISSRTFPDKYDYPLNCTPDGKWVLYVDGKSIRVDEKRNKLPEGIDHPIAWEGYVVDLYRYEIATGKKQKFAVIRDEGSFNAVSPDGTKIFLGGRHSLTIPMPEPKWNAVWLRNYEYWIQGRALWLLDSSGIVTSAFVESPNPNGVGIEIFGKNGWAKALEFIPKGGSYDPETWIGDFGVDRANRIYFMWSKFGRHVTTYHRLYRCDVKGRSLFCKKMSDYDIYAFKVLPAGDIVFMEAGGSCIRRLEVGQSEAKCIVEKGGDYDFIRIGAVSPNGQRLAFIRKKVAKSLKGSSSTSQSDLFVINLEN